jgi:hypothetical protein
MKKLTVLLFTSLGISLGISLFGGAVALWAADFWQNKPFTSWDQKEAQKLLIDSPWSKRVSISLPSNPQTAGGKGGRGGRGGGGPAGGSADPGINGGAPPGIAETSGGGGRGGGGGGFGAGSSDTGVTQAPSLQLLVSFRSALPLREALAKLKYGAEAGTSPEAKKLVEDKQEYYIVQVAGLPVYVQPHDNDDKKGMLTQTLLSARGKDPLTAMDVQFSMDGRNVDAYFIFPRTTEFTVTDKDVEFDTKISGLTIKNRFSLKNMVINGKLEM